MSSLLTKGGLTPGTIKNLTDTSKEVTFMFNPFEYSISKSTTWNETTVTGRNVPLMSFQSGTPMSLDLTLYFDTLDTRTSSGSYTSVRDHTLNLWALMMVDESNVNTTSGKSEPPAVAFEWGDVYFKAVVTSLTEKLTLFSETGIPLRAEMTVKLQQYFDPDDTEPQVPSQPTWTTTAPKTSTFTAGTRLDLIAAFSGTAQSMRKIATDNNIDDPLNIPSGTNLLT
jgi:Contractile injection system tube protein